MVMYPFLHPFRKFLHYLSKSRLNNPIRVRVNWEMVPQKIGRRVADRHFTWIWSSRIGWVWYGYTSKLGRGSRECLSGACPWLCTGNWVEPFHTQIPLDGKSFYKRRNRYTHWWGTMPIGVRRTLIRAALVSKSQFVFPQTHDFVSHKTTDERDLEVDRNLLANWTREIAAELQFLCGVEWWTYRITQRDSGRPVRWIISEPTDT